MKKTYNRQSVFSYFFIPFAQKITRFIASQNAKIL